MKIKDLKIGIVMALTLVFMGAPMIKASAAQVSSNNTTSNINQTESVTGTENEDLTAYGSTTEDDYFGDESYTEYGLGTEDRDFTVDESQFETTYNDQEYVNFYKKEFREEFGTENKFRTIYEDEYVKEEVNPATTEVKTTNKENGEVDSYNYFKDTLDPMLMNEEESAKYVEKQMKEAKEEFQEQYGTENKFKKVFEDANTIEEVNGYTGEYRITDKRTRAVADTYNYFGDMKEEYESIVGDTNK